MKTFKGIKNSSTQQWKCHKIWHQNKNYQVCKEAGKYDPQWREKSVEADPEMTQVTELVDKDIKMAIINLLQMLKKIG